jgi:aldose 1-epimerase
MITVSDFGKIKDTNVQLFTFQNSHGVIAKITNYGGILTSLSIPKGGKRRELVLGFNSLEKYLSPEYLENYPYFGAVIGRYANRINKGQVTINKETLQLPCNHGEHILHGGMEGFDKKIWKAEIIDNSTLTLSYLSPDNEESFPGNLLTKLTYRLTDKNEFQIEYEAETDKTTPINLTQHTYFNLSENSKDIRNHKLQVLSNHILSTNESLIPNGDFVDIRDTAFDFNLKKCINLQIDEVDNYDDCYVLGESSQSPRKVASLTDESEEVTMEVETTFPGLQVYTGKFINVTGDPAFGPFSGVALEAQSYPDAPNHPSFNQGWLRPGERYHHQTNYKFYF